MSYSDDKRELLKLKQGLIEESDSIKEKEHDKYEVHGFKKVSNFFYHYKAPVIIVFFFVLVVGFMTYNTLSREKMDARIMIFSNDQTISGSLYFMSQNIELAFEAYCQDYNEDNNVHVETYYIDINESGDPNYYISNQTKLFSEASGGIAQIYIANKSAFAEVIGEATTQQFYVNLAELYPDNPQIEDEYLFKIKGSGLENDFGYVESCPDDLYIAIRGMSAGFMSASKDVLEENHRKALEIFDNIVSRTTVNPDKIVK